MSANKSSASSDAAANAERLAVPPRRWPILTQQPRVPWLWVIVIQVPWFTLNVFECISDTMLTYTLREFTSVPWVITLVTSFNVLFNTVIGAPLNYLSDRIWTPWGRRRPFLIAGGLISCVFLLVIPFVRNFWLLVALLGLYEMTRDVGSSTEALEKEVVPSPQRGRAQALTQLARASGYLFFSTVLLWQFDHRYQIATWTVTGQQVAYWVGAMVALGTALFYLFVVRELPPPGGVPVRRRAGARQITLSKAAGAVRRFFVDIFGNRHHLAVLSVGVIMTVFWTDLGNLQPLLITEQFGYSKQTLGTIMAVGQVCTFVLAVPLGGWLADRVDRVTLFQVCLGGMLMHHASFYLYARYLAPNGVPPVGVLLGFSALYYVVGNVGAIAAVAMQFDFIETSRMGTIAAGLHISRTVFQILTRNVVGVWVTVYSARFVTSGRTDYLSGFHYLILISAIALAAAVWFGRLVRSGRLEPRGLLEQQRRLEAAADRG